MQPWKVLSSRVVLDSLPWLRVLADHVRLPNGHEIPDFYRIEAPDWAQVFAVAEDGRVMTIEQYKHGAGQTSLELPAGYLEPGEAPEISARRELLEETGLEAADWRFLGQFFVDGNRGLGATHVFLARQARQVAEPHREESEIMVQRWLTLDVLRAAWLGGRIANMGTMAAVGLALAVLEREP
jgi:ADP-ribose pyrophosphatase